MPRLIVWLFLSVPLLCAERIVTLSPAIAEIVAGVDALSDIVAVSDYTLYPEELEKRPKVGGYTTLSLEKVLAQRPTLVVGSPYQYPFLSRLESFGIRTQVLKLESIADIEISIMSLASLLGHDEAGEKLIAEIRQSQKRAPKLPHPQSVLIVFAAASSITRGVYVAGHDLFLEEILQTCGAVNAYTDANSLQPVLSAEGIIAANPDQVLLLFGTLDDVNPEAVKKAWQKLPIRAVNNGKINVLQNDFILIPSQRIVQSIGTICGVLQ